MLLEITFFLVFTPQLVRVVRVLFSPIGVQMGGGQGGGTLS